jgi:hypothetical protein
MTITIQAFPQFTTVVTGTITANSVTEDFTGTVSGSKLVFNVAPRFPFILEQLVGTVVGNSMQGAITEIDLGGGKTTGQFNLTKIG